MADKNDISSPIYTQWIGELKSRIHHVQTKALISVNRELISFYWELGSEIIQLQTSANWGSAFLQNLSKDLISEFPDIKGFSYRNLSRIRQWVIFYSSDPTNLATACGQIDDTATKQTHNQPFINPATSCGRITQQALAPFLNDLISIPWGHNGVIISKCSSLKEALYYVRQTITHGWSRSVLTHQIESDLYSREGSAISNFEATLPPAQSDLAQQTLIRKNIGHILLGKAKASIKKETPGPLNRKRSRKGSRGQRSQFGHLCWISQTFYILNSILREKGAFS